MISRFDVARNEKQSTVNLYLVFRLFCRRRDLNLKGRDSREKVRQTFKQGAVQDA